VNLGRLRWGEWIVALGALGLLLAPFRSWYTADGVRLTAWDMLENGRYLLLATAIIGLFLLIVVAAGRTAQTTFLVAARTTAVGFACTVYVVCRLLKRPDGGYVHADTGLFIGLASALLVTIGGLISMRDQTAGPADELETDSAPAPAAVPAPPGTASG
jgi:hypothetical protein